MPVRTRETIARGLKKLRPKTPLIVICSYLEKPQFDKIADEVVIAEHGVSQPLLEAVSKLAGDPED